MVAYHEYPPFDDECVCLYRTKCPGYKDLNQLLNQQGVGLTPAEMHGLISGILCGGNSDSSWQPLIHDLTNEGLAFGHELAEALRKMHAATSDSPEDDGFFSFICLKATMSASSIAPMRSRVG